MIGCFPDPYPDELLYSVCARFHDRMPYPNKKATLRELFGTINRTATIDLPCHLGQLLKNLPPTHRYTVNQIIDGHTMLPLFSHFLPPERILKIRQDMEGSGGLSIHKRSGVMASRIPTPAHLRFCPLCIEVDKRISGEIYWHRIHQIQGVEVCPVHHVFLENGDARQDSRRNPLQFISAENAVRTLPVRHLDQSDQDQQILLKIACDAAWLLKHPDSPSNLTAIYNRYLKLLVDQGLASFTGSIHVSELIEEFNGCYSLDLLKHLHCEFTGRDHVKTNWLLRLVRPPKNAHHPLYHLLLIQFLGCTAEEFFQLPTELSFFGEGSWPCLNPAANHFREPVILEYKLSSRLRDNCPTATFSCRCGFSYARSGPDSSPEDRFRIGRMLSFGPLWEAKLKQLWKDSSLSSSEVGRRLGVDPLTVRRHATRLNFPSSRPSRKSKPLNHAARLKVPRDLTAQAEKRRACRPMWTSTMRQSPNITLKALRCKHPREYAWLLQNDAEWLKRHSPHSRRRVRSTSGVDWRKRDAEYAVAVRDAATRLKNNPSRSVRVTRTAIGRTVGAVTLLRQKLHKLPLTAQVLAKVVETRVEYAVRRIRWAAECFTSKHLMPRPWEMVLRANVEPD